MGALRFVKRTQYAPFGLWTKSPTSRTIQLTLKPEILKPETLLEALASLNQIGAAINRLGSRDGISVEATLRLIAESATKVLPGASAVIYTYDPASQAFDLGSRVSAGEPAEAMASVSSLPEDAPRPAGIGMRAIGQRRPVLSYQETDLGIHPAKVRAGAKTMACFPLEVAGRPVGALYIYLQQARHFSQLELLMLDNFVNQAAMAIDQARRLANVRRDLARKEDELNRLRRAGLLISSRLRLEETLEAILHMALEVTNAHYGIFRLVDKSGQLVTRAVAGECLAQPLVEALPLDESSVMGWVAAHRQPVCIPDLRAEPWSRIYYPFDAGLDMRSELAVPLVDASGRLEGVLNLESPQVGAFGEEDSHLLQALATQALIAIQEARLLDALQDVAQRLLAQPCHQLLSHLVELACELLGVSISAIWSLEEEQLVLQVANSGYQHGERVPLHGSLSGLAILERSPVMSDDVRNDPRFNRPDLALDQGWRRALVVPVLATADREALGEREMIGAFGVYAGEGEVGRLAWSEWDKKVLTCLAHYAALAVHNAARQEALRAAQEQHAVAETFAAVGDVAANLFHSMNNKLGTIPVRVQGIQDKCRPALTADSYLAANLAEIERSAAEALAAVRENLSHLRPIHVELLDVAATVAAAVAAAELPAGVSVQLDGLEGLPPVAAGRRSLTLVFTNLLQNAADAMKGHGELTIQGARHGDWVQLAVGDNGPGIPPELHERIFELDFSGRRTTRPNKLGFGLWWVKTLVARLGGSVSVESDGRHGTTFYLRLPAKENT
jgi:signal transduction histidine kinase/putative methionine-R-sulfoxide reductase with GAF domain